MSHEYSSDSASDNDSDEYEEVIVKKTRVKKIDKPVKKPLVKQVVSEPVDEPVSKVRKARAPLSDDQKQVLRDRLAMARESKASKKLGQTNVETKVETKVKKVKKVKVEPESPPPVVVKPKRVYKKKVPVSNPF